jgi:cytochrome c oxidase cbb3-type subunit 4
MDINDLRSLVTVVSLFAFVGIIIWTWSRKNRAAFDEAAQLPFADEQGAQGASREGNQP